MTTPPRCAQAPLLNEESGGLILNPESCIPLNPES
jgi:hypothetical protein